MESIELNIVGKTFHFLTNSGMHYTGKVLSQNKNQIIILDKYRLTILLSITDLNFMEEKKEEGDKNV